MAGKRFLDLIPSSASTLSGRIQASYESTRPLDVVLHFATVVQCISMLMYCSFIVDLVLFCYVLLLRPFEETHQSEVGFSILFPRVSRTELDGSCPVTWLQNFLQLQIATLWSQQCISLFDISGKHPHDERSCCCTELQYASCIHDLLPL